jgi:hypothetical protein
MSKIIDLRLAASGLILARTSANYIDYAKRLITPFKASDKEIEANLAVLEYFSKASEANLGSFLAASINAFRALNGLSFAIEKASMTAVEAVEFAADHLQYLFNIETSCVSDIRNFDNQNEQVKLLRDRLLVEVYRYALSATNDLNKALTNQPLPTALNLTIDEAEGLLRETQCPIYYNSLTRKSGHSYEDATDDLYRRTRKIIFSPIAGLLTNRFFIYHYRQHWHESWAGRQSQNLQLTEISENIIHAGAAYNLARVQLMRIEREMELFPIPNSHYPKSFEFALRASDTREWEYRQLLDQREQLMARLHTENVIDAKRRARNRRKAKSKLKKKRK